MKYLAIVIMMFVGLTAMAQSEIKKIEIKTSAVCSMCKTRIEHDMKYEKGVESAVLDVDTKVLTVTYNSVKITPEDLREAVSDIGYDADEVKANAKRQRKLPGCCKPGSKCEHD